jgi:hypothetical protein
MNEHKQNLQVRKDMIEEIEECIKSGEMAIDENAAAKVDEQDPVNDEEVEEEQEPEELQEQEEKPANPPNLVPFNLQEFEERITKKVQL